MTRDPGLEEPLRPEIVTVNTVLSELGVPAGPPAQQRAAVMRLVEENKVNELQLDVLTEGGYLD